MANGNRFQDRPPRQKAALIVVGVLSLAVVAFTERDIHSRPAARIRGPKLLWRIFATNALGSLAYLGFGRR
jgi:hypothetical protein